MNIYIYGNNSFKKEIHQTLEHANIKFKLDSDSKIKDILKLSELKSAIEENPNDIYLIDDEKIIKKNGLSQKIKFLNPKDGIEEEFLLDNGIADLSVDSLKEIPKYILSKYEKEKAVDPEIQESIIDIVDDAYNENQEGSDLELDDELAKLLSSEEGEVVAPLEDFTNEIEEKEEIQEQNINLDELENLIAHEDDDEEEISNEELSSLIGFEEDMGLNNISKDYDDEAIRENEALVKEDNEILENEDIIKEIEDIDMSMDEELIKGVDMSSEFSELDSLSEQDILSALDGVESIEPLKVTSESKVEKKEVSNQSQNVNLGDSNVDDIAALISKLLNNKTLEITVKIKE